MAAMLCLMACGGDKTAAPAAPPATAPAPAVVPAPAAIAVGASVAAPWTNSSLYLANVIAVNGSVAKVKYVDDSSEADLDLAKLIPVVNKSWAVNDKVLAVWAGGRFYAGTITAVKPNNTYTVKWDDGSTPSDVDAGKIVAPPATTAN